MKNRALSLTLMSATLALVACGQPNKSVNSQSSADNAINREHCLSSNNQATCFVEVEKGSKSTFYAPESDYESLVTNPLLADLNISMQKVSDKSYAALFSERATPSVVYDESTAAKVDIYANQSAADSYTNSKGRRIAGGIGGGFTGALGGAATGATIGSAIPVVGTAIGAIGGAIVGGIGGGFTGAATFWDGKTNLVYHFGDSSSSQEVDVKDLQKP